MRFNPIKLLEGLLCTVPALLLTLAACGGGGTTTAPVVAPSTAPTGVNTYSGCYAINLNWTAVTGATGYNVYGAASGVAPVQLAAAATTSYTDAGLAPNTAYNYQVTATNSAGAGPKSATATATTKNSCTHMGGSIQGNALTLSGAVSTLAGAGPIYAGSTDGTGTAAQFNFPTGATTDGMYLYIADTLNNVIRKIVISTGAVTTIAGSTAGTSGFADNTTGTSATFHGPKGITISPDKSTLYVADTGNNAIRRIVISTTAVTTIAGVGPTNPGSVDNATGTSATFNVPAGITVDGTNLGTNLYVADTGSNEIRQIVISGTYPVTTIAGSTTSGSVDNATGTSATFTAPQGITTDGTNLYVADTGNNEIRRIVISGTYPVTTIAGSVTSGFADNATGTSATFTAPQGITTDGANLYVGDTSNNAIRRIVISGTYPVTTIAGSTAGTSGFVDAIGTAARFYKPAGTTTDGTNLYVVDTGNNAIREIQ